MSGIDRRSWLGSIGMSLVASRLPRTSITSPMPPEGAGKPLRLADFQPRSMLHVPGTKVPRSRHPVIDIHTHLSFAARTENRVGIGEEVQDLPPVAPFVPLMRREN